ncbi:response regulator [Ferruginibacter sp.]|uniref:response regulator n=1 Tax=Ferruginibacter sp. TaxID=1940288 RepID=UPI002658404F|nr:response regulator [Ferruginibacter sp.]
MTKTIEYILMVDDDEDDQMLFKEALKQVNGLVKCEVAFNGAEALEKLKINPVPDIIFLDLNMPVMNGFECLRAIKKDQFLKDIPVIIFTTANDNVTIERSRKLGATAFFHKPIDFNNLLNKLQQLLTDSTSAATKQSSSMPDFLI